MGYGIQTLPRLLEKLKRSPKDWCLVAIHDPENPSRAGQQLERLLDDLDEDSGEFFDFFLPGYEDGRDASRTRRGPSSSPVWQDCGVYNFVLVPTPGREPIRWSERTRRFSHRLFRDFVMGIEHLPHNQWRYNGDSSFLLFQTFRSPEFRPDSFWDLRFVADYNLDDIVLNGRAVNQFLRRMCLKLEKIGRFDTSTVKNGLDEVYRELIMPPENRTPEQDLRLREGTSRLLRSHPAREYVFISYSTKDRERACAARSLLESAGIRCWMAPRDIPSSSNYAYVIERAISDCAVFLLLVSQDSVRSVWVQKEVLYALGRLQQEERVHAAWLAEPFDLEATQSGMAFALQDIQIDERLLKGDSTGILIRFLTKGVQSPDQVPVSRWGEALTRHPDWANDSVFSSRCPWNRFSGQDWRSVLKAMSDANGVDPEKAIPFDSLAPDGWAKLLSRAPNYASHCNKWDEFSTGDWLDLLRARPEFAEKCRNWSAFSTLDWERILLARPELGRYRTAGEA